MNGTNFDSLREQVRGQVITSADAGYDAARAVFNGMIDKRPAAVVRVSQVADVIASVNFARDHGIAVAVRGGGHSGPGFGTADDALVIDFAGTRGVRVDPARKTARTEAKAAKKVASGAKKTASKAVKSSTRAAKSSIRAKKSSTRAAKSSSRAKKK